jgi:hypothetical protein
MTEDGTEDHVAHVAVGLTIYDLCDRVWKFERLCGCRSSDALTRVGRTPGARIGHSCCRCATKPLSFCQSISGRGRVFLYPEGRMGLSDLRLQQA